MDPSLERTSKRVDGYQDTTDIRIDRSILPPFREILVHSFVRDGREQRHVGYADLFLLETFFPIRLHASFTEQQTSANHGCNIPSRLCYFLLLVSSLRAWLFSPPS